MLTVGFVSCPSRRSSRKHPRTPRSGGEVTGLKELGQDRRLLGPRGPTGCRRQILMSVPTGARERARVTAGSSCGGLLGRPGGHT